MMVVMVLTIYLIYVTYVFYKQTLLAWATFMSGIISAIVEFKPSMAK